MTTDWRGAVLKIIGHWGLGLGLGVILLLLSTTPLRIAHLGEVRPAFLLIAVYYGSIIRSVPPFAVFTLGLILDLLSAFPPGMNAFILLVVQMLTASQRKFLLGQSFLVIWAGFALVALGAGLVQWAIFSLFDSTIVSAPLMLISVLFSAFLFPVAVLPLAALHRMLSDSAATD